MKKAPTSVQKPRRKSRKVVAYANTACETPNEQRVIMPWDTSRWEVIKRECNRKITNAMEFESMLAAIRTYRVKPQSVTSQLESYKQLDNPPMPYDTLWRAIANAQACILSGPKIFRGHSLRICDRGNITFNTAQCACVVAMMWFGLFDYEYISRGNLGMDEFSDPNMTSSSVYLLGSLICYFASADTRADMRTDARKVIIKRTRAAAIDWAECERAIVEPMLGELGAHHDDSYAPAIWVSSHEYIGGDLFTAAITQEEIILGCRPDALISVLFCPRLHDDTITVFGARKYSQYAGVGSSLRIVSTYNDPTCGDILARTCLIFADASKKSTLESQMNDFDRDLNKAYAGMSSIPVGTVASSVWTYGYNHVPHDVKFLQLLLAASACGCTLEYYPIGRDYEEYIEPFMAWLHTERVTIGELYDLYYQCLDYIDEMQMRLSEVKLLDMFMDA
jgi:hypothetical protein